LDLKSKIAEQRIVFSVRVLAANAVPDIAEFDGCARVGRIIHAAFDNYLFDASCEGETPARLPALRNPMLQRLVCLFWQACDADTGVAFEANVEANQ